MEYACKFCIFCLHLNALRLVLLPTMWYILGEFSMCTWKKCTVSATLSFYYQMVKSPIMNECSCFFSISSVFDWCTLKFCINTKIIKTFIKLWNVPCGTLCSKTVLSIINVSYSNFIFIDVYMVYLVLYFIFLIYVSLSI